MARKNRLTDLVFSNINKRNTPIDKFLNTDLVLSLSTDPLLNHYKILYNDIITKISKDLELLSDLEEIITQLRCKKYAPKDFNLSITNNSIYVKCLFYRNDRKIKDIRIIAGNVSTFGNDLKKLAHDQSFITMFTDKMKIVMQKEIEKTIKNFENKNKNSYIYV
jgi:hypothetical protein